jgi:hypothetical protein
MPDDVPGKTGYLTRRPERALQRNAWTGSIIMTLMSAIG